MGGWKGAGGRGRGSATFWLSVEPHPLFRCSPRVLSAAGTAMSPLKLSDLYVYVCVLDFPGGAVARLRKTGPLGSGRCFRGEHLTSSGDRQPVLCVQWRPTPPGTPDAANDNSKSEEASGNDAGRRSVLSFQHPNVCVVLMVADLGATLMAVLALDTGACVLPAGGNAIEHAFLSPSLWFARACAADFVSIAGFAAVVSTSYVVTVAGKALCAVAQHAASASCVLGDVSVDTVFVHRRTGQVKVACLSAARLAGGHAAVGPYFPARAHLPSRLALAPLVRVPCCCAQTFTIMLRVLTQLVLMVVLLLCGVSRRATPRRRC